VSLTEIPDMQGGLGTEVSGVHEQSPGRGPGDKVPQKLNDIFTLKT